MQEETQLQVKLTAKICQCTKCNKMFRSEGLLDKQMGRYHAHMRHNWYTSFLPNYCGCIILWVPMEKLTLPPRMKKAYSHQSTIRFRKEDKASQIILEYGNSKEPFAGMHQSEAGLCAQGKPLNSLLFGPFETTRAQIDNKWSLRLRHDGGIHSVHRDV